MFVFLIWFKNIPFHSEKKKRKVSLKRKLYHYGGFLMAFTKDYGFGEFFICPQERMNIPTMPRTPTDHS